MTSSIDSQSALVETNEDVEIEETSHKPEEELSDDVIIIPRTLFNYGVIAIVFFVLGGVIGAVITGSSRGSEVTAEVVSTAVAAALNSRGIAGSGSAQGPAPVINVSVDDDPDWGPEDAPVTIVEFSDFQCPFCGRFHAETYPRLRATYGDSIRFVYRDYPILELHPNAALSAQAAECADEQGAFWEFHDLLLTNQDKSSRSDLGEFAAQVGLDMDSFNECLDSGRYEQEVARDVQEGSSYGVRGTPTFFINGRPLVGAQPYEVFAAAIDAALANAQQSSNTPASS